jgi:general secretion pathway protein G
MQKKLKKRQGFMLLELVIVIAIIGILAAVAIPNFTGMTNEAKVARIKADLSTVSAAAAVSYTKNGTYPKSVDELVQSGELSSHPESEKDLDDKKYAIDDQTGEVTGTFKTKTYSSFGKTQEEEG